MISSSARAACFASISMRSTAFPTRSRTWEEVKTLNLYMMGEPFVNRHLPDFIKIAKDKRIADRIIVTSNGSLLKEDIARRVIEAKLDYLRISIYGGEPGSHARKTQSKVPLDRVWSNVRKFRELRDAMDGLTHIYVKMIDLGDARENQAFLDRFAPVADEAKIEPAMNWNDPDEGMLAQVDRDAMLGTAHFRHKKTVCPFPFYTLVVHSDLRVSVCCVDWAKQAVVGDAATQTLAEIWRGAPLREFQLEHLRGRKAQLEACRSCTYLHTAPDNLDGLTAEEYAARLADA